MDYGVDPFGTKSCLNQVTGSERFGLYQDI